MELIERERRRKIRLAISETMMVLAVIVTVVILAFLVSGYHVNSDFEVERQGMLQIYSIPTGASVEVDGEAPWYQRTNTSKVLSAGEHQIRLTRDGYDSWSKTVKINEGLLYRLQYPRLFLQNREPEQYYDVADTTFASVSKDGRLMLLANSTTKWSLLSLDSEQPKVTELDVSPFVTSTDITSISWNNDNNRVLIKTGAEWALLNINNISESVNLTRTFVMRLDDVRIFDNSASNLLALSFGSLYKLDVPARQASSAIVSNVINYNFYGTEIIFTATVPTGSVSTQNNSSDAVMNEDLSADFAPTHYVGIARIGDDKLLRVKSLTSSARAYLSRFYDDRYITIISENNITIYRRSDFSVVLDKSISFIPAKITVGIGGDFVFLNDGANVATVDMETRSVREWSLASADYNWLDAHMIHVVSDGALMVYDYDGLNRRDLATGVTAGRPVNIAADRWLYYFSGTNLIRERIVN